MRHTQFVNYALYQAGWFACVLGGAWHWPWTGAAIAIVLTATHVAWSRERALESRLVLLAAGVGLVVEVYQIAAGTYGFSAGTLNPAVPPLWLIALWGQLGTTFRFSLRAIMTSSWRAALFGGLGGPLAFVGGERLGAVTLLPPVALGLIRLSVAWTIALVVFSLVARRVTAGQKNPSYLSLRRQSSG